MTRGGQKTHLRILQAQMDECPNLDTHHMTGADRHPDGISGDISSTKEPRFSLMQTSPRLDDLSRNQPMKRLQRGFRFSKSHICNLVAGPLVSDLSRLQAGILTRPRLTNDRIVGFVLNHQPWSDLWPVLFGRSQGESSGILLRSG